MKTLREQFDAAYKLIADPETFGQGSNQVCNSNPERYCTATALGGNIRKHEDRQTVDRAICAAAGIDDDVCSIFRWNDTHTHAEVVEGWQRAGVTLFGTDWTPPLDK